MLHERLSKRWRLLSGHAPRSLPLGAQYSEAGTTFRLWTTRDEGASLLLYDQGHEHPAARIPMDTAGDGFYETTVRVDNGALYRFALGADAYPDPWARWLPEGVHGPAAVQSSDYPWSPVDWPGIALAEAIIYEVHIGTFTPEGTYRAAIEKLPSLVELGVTVIELMPLSTGAGARGWGYDGVAHFAPFAPYGKADDLKALVDACHCLGLGVIIDVVYNHFGPAGNYLSAFSPDYFTTSIKTPWGAAPDYRNPQMRQLVLDNALYWINEFRMDGLRLDAVHEIPDPSGRHIVAELCELVQELPGPRRIIIAEDDRNSAETVRRLRLDGVWADDFHHVLHVLLTGEHDGYYACYAPSLEALARTINRGWFYEGQPWPLTGKPRGAPTEGMGPSQLVYALQNHDQIGNRPFGRRLNHLVAIDAYLAASMLLLFLPMTPLLFMGQEWAASSPFCYFTDHDAELGAAIVEGRRAEFEKFAAFAESGRTNDLPDPQAASTFERSKLDWSERDAAPHARSLELYRDMLSLRKRDDVLAKGKQENLLAETVDGLLRVKRWHGNKSRTLLVNLSDGGREVPRAMRTGRVLLASSTSITNDMEMPPWSAIILGATVDTTT